MSRDFRKIKAWQLADELTVMTYSMTTQFPHDEMYGLISQLRGATSSVAANIAEGANRSTQKEYLHFLSMARGSLAGAEYFFHLSKRLSYLSVSDYNKIDEGRKEAASVLNGLMRAVHSESTTAIKSPDYL